MPSDTAPLTFACPLSRIFGRLLGCGLLLALTCLTSMPVAARGDGRPAYGISAALSLEAPQVRGSVAVRVVNSSDRVLHDAVFFLFPNRFARADPAVDDFLRPFVYPVDEFDPGWIEIVSARVAGAATTVTPVTAEGLPPRIAVRVALPALAPREAVTVTLVFRTTVPRRYGSFGQANGQLTLNGGWYPYLAALRSDGRWALDEPPAPARFRVRLTWPEAWVILLNGERLDTEETHDARVDARYLSLVAAPDMVAEEISADGTHVRFFHPRRRGSLRWAPGPTRRAAVFAATRRLLAARPSGVSSPVRGVTLIEAPLRLQLSTPGEGAVLVSDRLFAVVPLLRSLHEAEFGRVLYAELLRDRLSRREPNRDYGWVREAVAAQLVRRALAEEEQDRSRFGRWLRRLGFFAVVDRLRKSRCIPFAGAIFGRRRAVDRLRTGVATFNRDRPPGRVVMEKVREQVGPGEFDLLAEPCLTGPMPFRSCLGGAVTSSGIDRLLDMWLRPYPQIDYRIESLDSGRRERGGYRATVVVRRDVSRPFAEPVTVRLRSIGGRSVDLSWRSRGDTARLSVLTDRPLASAEIDPAGHLIDDEPRNNILPPPLEILLDSADVEVSSSDFGLAGLLVLRRRDDDRRDLALAGFYTNRGSGVTAGARLHWGARLRSARRPHSLYAFYGIEALDADFHEHGRTGRRTRGQSARLGFRYGYANAAGVSNPTHAIAFAAYADWYDRVLGGDFDYADWGARAAFAHPVAGERNIIAIEISAGFSRALGPGGVPNQGLYSLGGSRSIRGVGAEEDLGRNIFLVRAELRRRVWPDLDIDWLDLIFVRDLQLRLFADAGRVDNSAAGTADPRDASLGIGVGAGIGYELLGFLPSRAYIELATRADGREGTGDVQVLFGTRQAF